MPLRAVCPECGSTITLDEESHKTTVECRQCGTQVPVPGGKPSAPPPLPKKEAAQDTGFEILEDEKPPAPARAQRPEVNQEEKAERPRRRDEDDEDELDDAGRPAVGRRGRDEDEEDEDEDDRPRRRRPAAEAEEEEDDEPPARGRAAAKNEDDDEDDQPRARRRDSDDDEDEDDEPRRRRRDSDEDEEEDADRKAGQRSLKAALAGVREEEGDAGEGVAYNEDEDEEEGDGHSIPRRKGAGVYEGGGRRGSAPAPARSGKGLLIVLALFAFVVLGAGGGAIAYFMWPKDDKPVVRKPDDTPPVDPGPPEPNPPEPKPPEPKGPQARDLAIHRVNFDGERKTIALPGKVAEICAGGDGRYLFLHCPDQKKLLVYDASQAEITKELPTAGKEARFAAGAGKLLLIDNAARSIQRFDLLTLEKDKEAAFPFEGTIEDISLGSGSNGPALVVGTAPNDAWPIYFVDVETLSRADVGWGAAPPANLPRALRFRAAASGSRWAGIATEPDARGAVIVTREGKKLTAELVEPDKVLGFAALSNDGQTLISRYGGNAVGTTATRPPSGDSAMFATAATSGGLFAHVLLTKGREGGGLNYRVAITNRPTRPTPSTPRVDVPQPYQPGDSLPPDRHLFFVPEAGAIVVCPSGPENKLEIVKFNYAAAIKSAFLLVTSTPPDTFRPGSQFRYRVRSIAQDAKRQYELTGPPGSSIDSDGVVTWSVPPDEKRERVQFQLGITATGVRTSHNFDLFNAAAPAPKSPEPKPKDPKDPMPKDPKDPKTPDPKIPGTPPNIAPGVKLVAEPPGRLPIAPPEMKDPHVEVALPSPIRDACVGGGGRFIIFHCPTARKMLILDVNTLKIEKTITLNADDVLFAAGMEKLMVIYPEEKVVLRYSLASFKLEADISLEVRQRPTTAAMGSATSGPLILGGVPSQNNASKMALTFVDLDTMKEVLIEKAEGDFKVSFGAAAHLRASANGQTLGAWLAQLRPSGLQVARLKDNTIGGSYLAETVGHVAPGADGQTLFTEKGMYNTKGEPVGKRDPAVPAVHGNWYLTLAPNAKGPAGAQRVSVWEAGKDAPIAEFDDLPGFDGKRDPFERDNPTLALDRRLFLVPEAKVLVVVPPAANKLHVYRLEGKK